jgi:hypothetical protein
MPQTPSFFIQRGLWLYNRLAGQRLSLRCGAAAATLPVGRTNRMTRQILVAAVSGTVPGITLVAFAFMTGYERSPGNSKGWWIVAALCLLCAGNSVLGVTIVRRRSCPILRL